MRKRRRKGTARASAPRKSSTPGMKSGSAPTHTQKAGSPNKTSTVNTSSTLGLRRHQNGTIPASSRDQPLSSWDASNGKITAKAGSSTSCHHGSAQLTIRKTLAVGLRDVDSREHHTQVPSGASPATNPPHTTPEPCDKLAVSSAVREQS
jgi:hypothetical protein